MRRTFHSHWMRPWILTARFDSNHQKVLKAKSFRDIISIDFSNHLIVGGHSMEQLKFVIFSDFHYKKGMYASTVDHMKQILTRARETGASFVIHCGDFCNDYSGSPELIRAYLQNPQGLAVYGVYGNHELESDANSMQTVTPLLCNREVIWGTRDGTIGDGSIAYYYTDIGAFRLIGLDTNYSLTPDEAWQHNTTCSWGPPSINHRPNSLGDEQLAWLSRILDDAAEKGLHCMLFSHGSFCRSWRPEADTDAVQALCSAVNKKRPGTVIAMWNGHYHTNHHYVRDGILYWDVNTTINGEWIPERIPHYSEGQTFDYTEYDADGRETDRYARDLTELWMSGNTWYFCDPLSAVVTVSEDGHIRVEGSKTEWVYGILPPARPAGAGCEPEISDFDGKVFS